MIGIFASLSDFMGDAYNELEDIVQLSVTEELNGIFELLIVYPVKGNNSSMLVPNAIITSPAEIDGQNEPFRIYDVSTSIDGLITARARHLVYDLDGVAAYPFEAIGITDAIFNLNDDIAGADVQYFEIVNNGVVNSTSQFSISYMQPMLPLLIGSHSISKVFGAEISYRWDNEEKKEYIYINASRAGTSDETVSYGVNIIDMTKKRNSESEYSHVMSFVKYDDESGVSHTVYCAGVRVSTGMSLDRQRCKIIDMSSEFDTPPTELELYEFTRKYVDKMKWNEITSMTFDFVPLSSVQNDGFEYTKPLRLGSLTNVSADIIGVDAVLQVVRAEYNVLLNKYSKMTCGDRILNVSDTIADMSVSGPSESIEPKLKYYDDAQGANYTLSSGGYAYVAYPNGLKGNKIVAIGVNSYSSATGAFSIAAYGGKFNAAGMYIYGTPGTVITNISFRYWYLG